MIIRDLPNLVNGYKKGGLFGVRTILNDMASN